MKWEFLLNKRSYISLLQELFFKGMLTIQLTNEEKEFLKEVFRLLDVRLEFSKDYLLVGFQYNYQRNVLQQYISALVKLQNTGCFTFSYTPSNNDKHKKVLLYTLDYFGIPYSFEYPSIYLKEE